MLSSWFSQDLENLTTLQQTRRRSRTAFIPFVGHRMYLGIRLQQLLLLGICLPAWVCCFVPHCNGHNPTTRKSNTSIGFFNFSGKKQSGPGGETNEEQGKKDIPPQPKPAVRTNPDDEPDLVEKIFKVFFGEPEQNPLGLKRFDEKRFPEQYPATTTDFNVEPVATDDKIMAQLRPLLKNTNLESRGLRLTYDANRDGWDPYKFHRKVDRLGPALVVLQTKSGLVCGGYNPKGWVGYGEARGSIAAFLFRRKAPGSSEWIKLKKVGGGSYAQGE